MKGNYSTGAKMKRRTCVESSMQIICSNLWHECCVPFPDKQNCGQEKKNMDNDQQGGLLSQIF